MTPPNFKRARKLLIAGIAGALLVIAATTGLYYWKGLGDMRAKDDDSKSYYVTY